MDGAAIDWLTLSVLDAFAGGQLITPAALMLLVHRYVATGRADVRDALGPALSQAIDRCAVNHSPDLIDLRPDWLMVLLEAEAIADDDRVRAIAESLVDSIRGEWPSRGRVRSAMQSIDACLRAASGDESRARLVAASIDELERVVSMAYEPGEGVSSLVQQHAREDGDLRDHVAAASTLLSAYQVTARLPYSMLAEELIQFARRSWWDEKTGCFSRGQPRDDGERFLANAEAARVLCRLATLHDDPEYRAVAVIAHSSDYASDAQRTLESLEPLYRARGVDAAIYGVALGEWLAAAAGRETDQGTGSFE